MKRKSLTADRAKYIRDNYQEMTLVAIANTLQVGLTTISRWVKRMGLNDKRKLVPVVHARTTKKVKVVPVVIEDKKISRPPAQYSNATREQHIERILKMAI